MRTSLSKITQPPGNRHKRPGKVSGRRVIHRAMRSYGRLGAAEAVDQTFPYIRSGIGRVPSREIMEQIKLSDAGKLALAKQDTPQTKAAPDLSSMSPIQKLAYARAIKPDTKK